MGWLLLVGAAIPPFAVAARLYERAAMGPRLSPAVAAGAIGFLAVIAVVAAALANNTPEGVDDALGLF